MVDRLSLQTREDFANLMFAMLEPLKEHYSDGKACLKLGYSSAHYSDEVAGMEGFSRILWGLGAYLTGGGRNEEWEEIYRAGIVNGTNPKSP